MVAVVVAAGPGAVGCRIPNYSAVVVGSHCVADFGAVAGIRLVVGLAAARRYLAFAYR